MAIGALHAWHVAMRWTAPFPFPSRLSRIWNAEEKKREGGLWRVAYCHCCGGLFVLRKVQRCRGAGAVHACTFRTSQILLTDATCGYIS